MLFDFESLHLSQPYIKSSNFPRDEGGKQAKHADFRAGVQCPLKKILLYRERSSNPFGND